jgi:hypothetical protein
MARQPMAGRRSFVIWADDEWRLKLIRAPLLHCSKPDRARLAILATCRRCSARAFLLDLIVGQITSIAFMIGTLKFFSS